MNTLISINKDVAEAVFGWKHGRPTISRRVGGVIAQITGITPEAGTDLFHLGLFVAGVAVLSKKR